MTVDHKNTVDASPANEARMEGHREAARRRLSPESQQELADRLPARFKPLWKCGHRDESPRISAGILGACSVIDEKERGLGYSALAPVPYLERTDVATPRKASAASEGWGNSMTFLGIYQLLVCITSFWHRP